MSQELAGITAFGNYTVLIPATTNAVTTAAIELRMMSSYTFTSSSLSDLEEIVVEIFDVARNDWKPFCINGSRVKLTSTYEFLTITQTEAIIRFVKIGTGTSSGLVMSVS